MSQELVTRDDSRNVPAFGHKAMPAAVNVGAVAIEQERAIAEAQGQLVLAKKFPRDLNAAHAELMTACKSPAFAAQAFYSVPNRGSGPSIRFAEEVARVYGNFQYGHRELSRDEKKSEVEVFAWDMQNNNRSVRQLTVQHVVDTKAGPKPCRDQADIDNLIANKASKQIRGRILALMPKWLVADAIEECRKTLAGNNAEPFESRVRRMTQAFTQFGVTTAHLEAYLKHPLDKMVIDELVDLQGVFNALKEGVPASEFFGAAGKDETATQDKASLAETAKGAAAAAEQAKPQARQKAAPRATQKAEAAAEAKPEAKPEPAASPEPEPAAEKKSTPAEKRSTPVEEPAPENTEIPAADAGVEGEGDLF